MPLSSAYRSSTRHGDLGSDFYDIVAPAAFPQHVLRYRNQRWAARVGLDTLTDREWLAHFGQFEPLPGSFPQPLALRYHGHQFRTYNPYLGDGRGFLFGQVHDVQDGRLLDLATKGSGQTPWSRHADGRLTLKGGVREVLATEMLEALGVETSKTFSLVETGEELERGDEPSPTRSAVLVRLSHSHIRIGTFQRLLFLDQPENLRKLLDHTIRTYMPDLWVEDEPARATAFLEEVCRRVARMGAQWMAAGFVHGVLNTDNINVTGESFDYGPWRFLPTYDPGFTAAYFDETGLYAFGRQPDALLWSPPSIAPSRRPFSSGSACNPPASSVTALWRKPFGSFSTTRKRRSNRHSLIGTVGSSAPNERSGAPHRTSTPVRPSSPCGRRLKVLRRNRAFASITPISPSASPARCWSTTWRASGLRLPERTIGRRSPPNWPALP
jgi:uncharacterized protein YdiU (UPF0061 family)